MKLTYAKTLAFLFQSRYACMPLAEHSTSNLASARSSRRMVAAIKSKKLTKE